MGHLVPISPTDLIRRRTTEASKSNSWFLNIGLDVDLVLFAHPCVTGPSQRQHNEFVTMLWPTISHREALKQQARYSETSLDSVYNAPDWAAVVVARSRLCTTRLVIFGRATPTLVGLPAGRMHPANCTEDEVSLSCVAMMVRVFGRSGVRSAMCYLGMLTTGLRDTPRGGSVVMRSGGRSCRCRRLAFSLLYGTAGSSLSRSNC